MNWIRLESLEQLHDLTRESENTAVLIFKHSTRCSTSRMALDRLERNWNKEEMQSVVPYFLDLISYRQLSNLIADQFGVVHESPQVLIIQNKQSLLDLSHFDIEYSAIRDTIKN
jgi:bacillithiol system protein YtxJ